MMDLNKIYTEDWMRSRADPKGARYKSAQIITKILIRDLKPKSVLDLGCGPCNFSNAFSQGKCDVMAMDGSEHAEKMLAGEIPFVRFDFSTKFELWKTFDLVLCLEVLEHIGAKYEQVALSNIVSHVEKYAVITVAGPNQSGLHHVNCKSKEYWVGRLDKLGLKRRKDLQARWQKEWREAKVIACYADNLLVYEKSPQEKK